MTLAVQLVSVFDGCPVHLHIQSGVESRKVTFLHALDRRQLGDARALALLVSADAANCRQMLACSRQDSVVLCWRRGCSTALIHLSAGSCAPALRKLISKECTMYGAVLPYLELQVDWGY